uniref:Stathmin n=2 Tax=Magallana gigas TaxID=29159 RepID=A0A8W8KE54_MAGGI
MSTACNWLSLFLCLRGTSNNKKAIHQIHPNQRSFDAVVVWKGKGLQKSTGGVAYDYILKPAADNAPKISSPPKDKPLTHDEIFEKLQKAEARRQSLEAQKLEFVAKEKQRMQEALMKSQKEEEEKAKAAQAKLRRSMEITKENRELQIMSLQEKLREHAKHIEEVCKASETM